MLYGSIDNLDKWLKHLEQFDTHVKPYMIIYNAADSKHVTSNIRHNYIVKECSIVWESHVIIVQRGDIK